MSLKDENLNCSELKGKAKRQLKTLQGGHMGILGSQQGQHGGMPYELHQGNQGRAEKQLSDLNGLLKVMADHHLNAHNSSKTERHVNPVNSGKPSKLPG